jgi:UDP-glucose 4-epimerase
VGKKIIVFGGSGFLGSHVADALSERGFEVTLFDLKESRWVKPSQKMIVGDITGMDQVLGAVKGHDIVYHFAGLADLDDAVTRPAETVSKNIMGTVNLLEAAVKENIERFVFASSIYVYSNLGGFYRCSKQSCELYIEEYRKKYDLNFSILRYGTLYGPRADNRNSIWRYLNEGLTTGKIKFPGTGQEIREYIQVRDAAKLSVDILDSKYANQHIIITGHHPMKVADMLSMVNEMLGNKIEFEFQGMPSENHYNVTPYSFTPKIGKKLVSDFYIDMGQGILECLNEISGDAKEGSEKV